MSLPIRVSWTGLGRGRERGSGAIMELSFAGERDLLFCSSVFKDIPAEERERERARNRRTKSSRFQVSERRDCGTQNSCFVLIVKTRSWNS